MARKGLLTLSQNGLEITEETILDMPNVYFAVESENPELGSLKITTSHVYWFAADNLDKAIMIDFHALSMHSVSRDPEMMHSPCVFCLVEVEAKEHDMEEEHEECETVEVRIFPMDRTDELLETIYNGLCDGAALNPDDVESEEGDFVWREDDQLAAEERLDSVFTVQGQPYEGSYEDFEDAEEEQESKQ